MTRTVRSKWCEHYNDSWEGGREKRLLTPGEEAEAFSETLHLDSGSSEDFLKDQELRFVPERVVV